MISLKIREIYKEQFIVPEELMMILVSGKNLNRIQSTYGVHISLPSARNGRSEILVKGSEAEDVFAAKKEILEGLLPWILSLDVDERYVEGVLWTAGYTVRYLEANFDVKICFEDGKAHISGKRGGTEAARDTIISIYSKYDRNMKADAANDVMF